MDNKIKDEVIKEATAILELWLDPMKIPCPASGHNTPNTLSCTCRQVELRCRTKEFLTGKVR